MNGIGKWTVVVGLCLICAGIPGCAKKSPSITDGSDPEPEKVQYPRCVLDPGTTEDFGPVNLGETSQASLLISNGNSVSTVDNMFAYEILIPGSSGDCSAFSIPELVRKGILGPGGFVSIPVTFEPTVAKEYQCDAGLLSLQVSGGAATDVSITNACSSTLTWGGAAVPVWEECSMGEYSSDLYGISGSLNKAYAVGEGGTVLRKDGNTCHWTREEIPVPFAISGLDFKDVWVLDTRLWVVGERETPGGGFGDAWGTILHFDGGAWAMQSDGWLIQYESVWGSNESDVWFGGQGVATDFPNARHWDGSTLDSLQIHSGWSNVAGLHGTSPANVWAVFDQPYQSVFHYDGTGWTEDTRPFMNQPLFDVWAGSNGHTYAVGANGAIYHFNGTDWLDESIESETNDFLGVWVNGLNDGVVVVGENGVIYHSDGTHWVEASLDHLGGAEDLRDVYGLAVSSDLWVVYAVGNEGRILMLKPYL